MSKELPPYVVQIGDYEVEPLRIEALPAPLPPVEITLYPTTASARVLIDAFKADAWLPFSGLGDACEARVTGCKWVAGSMCFTLARRKVGAA